MRKSIIGLSAIALSAISAPALADGEDTSTVKITGNVALVSDYRFRGFSQSSEDPAVQGGITLTHESGLYVGTWASSISFAGKTEIDLFAGYSKEVASGLTVDGGLLFYLYPDKSNPGVYNFFEPYLNVTKTFGPAAVKVGVNYAWDQDALGGNSAIYFHVEPSVSIPGTPIGLNAHIGYAESDAFPGGGGNDHHVWDYSVGATATWKNLTLGVSYVTTDELKSRAELSGADDTVVFSLTAAF